MLFKVWFSCIAAHRKWHDNASKIEMFIKSIEKAINKFEDNASIQVGLVDKGMGATKLLFNHAHGVATAIWINDKDFLQSKGWIQKTFI